MRANFFKQRKNQRFNYTPRYYQGKDTGNIYSFDSKFRKFRDTANAIDFGAQWAKDRQASSTRCNRGINSRFLLIMLVLLLIFLWIIDFDLSIFSRPTY